MPDHVAERVAETYDKSVDDPISTAIREGSLYYNYGYWHRGAQSMEEASECMMAELVARSEIPAGASVLDVACGMGATTNYIATRTGAGRVVGINISAKQLRLCRTHAPDAEFHKMSATKMEFSDGAFDILFCIEAAFHFNTRRDFLKEAHRVLKKGGRLVMTDMLNPAPGPVSIPENELASVDAYAELLSETGFEPVRIVDRTEDSIGGFVPFVLFFRDTMMQRGEIGRQWYALLTQRMRAVSEISYVEVVADAR